MPKDGTIPTFLHSDNYQVAKLRTLANMDEKLSDLMDELVKDCRADTLERLAELGKTEAQSNFYRGVVYACDIL